MICLKSNIERGKWQGSERQLSVVGGNCDEFVLVKAMAVISPGSLIIRSFDEVFDASLFIEALLFES